MNYERRNFLKHSAMFTGDRRREQVSTGSRRWVYKGLSAKLMLS